MRERVDVFILVHPKDLPIVPCTVRSVRRWLHPAPGRITLVTKRLSPDVANALLATGVTEIVDEVTLPEASTLPQVGSVVVDGVDRTNWYKQQFMKWQVRHLATTEDYFVIDSDTILIAPLHLYTSAKTNFVQSLQHHAPYFSTFEALFGYRPVRRSSFIVDYMLFNRVVLNELIDTIERRSGLPWTVSILSALPRKNISEFSEFETYGNFISERYPERTSVVPQRHSSVMREEFVRHYYHLLAARLAGHISIAYHEYNSKVVVPSPVFAKPSVQSSAAALLKAGARPLKRLMKHLSRRAAL